MGNNKNIYEINTRSKSGITLIALIITIIIMIILVGVTINVALNGGLFKKANKASLEQEKHSILERIIAMSKLKDDGKIDVTETYKNVKKEFTVPQEKMNTSKTEVKFKVQGKYGIYGYKITETEINFDNSNLGSQDPVASEPGSFTFNEINDLFIEYIRAEAPDTATDDEIKEMLLEILSDELLAIQQIQGNETVSVFVVPTEIFWKTVGKSYAGQYGIVAEGESLEEGFALRDSDNIITTYSSEFSEYYTGSTNNSANIFSFIDGGDVVAFYLSKAGAEFSAIVSTDGKDAEGNESESIMSWDEFLEAYGDIKFTFSKAEGSQDPELKESYAVRESFWNLTAEKEEISYIYKGETYTNTLTANEKYALPETINVEIDGETATEGMDYTWEITTDEETGKIKGKIVISNVTGNLYISADGTYNAASIWYNLSNIDESNLVYEATKGTPFSCTFKAYEGYLLPETIEVRMNGETLTPVMDYIWDPSTGKFETTGNVTGDISISIYAEYNLVNVNYNLSNIDESNLVYQATKGTPFSCTFKAEEGYDLPETIEVTMNGETLTAVTDYIWEQSTGKFETTGNVTGDIVITIPKGLVGSEITLDADQDGKEETWIVLYKKSDYIEVISKNTMGEDLELGKTDKEAIKNATDINGNGKVEDIEIAIYSYNNAIDRINNYCEGLIKIDNLGVRSVGSKPSDPSYRNTSKPCAIYNLNKWENKTAWNTYGVLGEDEDSNFNDDWKQMDTLGIGASGDAKEYWLASRLVSEYWYAPSAYGEVSFRVLYEDAGGIWNVQSLYRVDTEDINAAYNQAYAVRPVVKLQYP